MYVRDANGDGICKDDDDTDVALCVWTSKSAGDFLITLRNRSHAVRYAGYLEWL